MSEHAGIINGTRDFIDKTVNKIEKTKGNLLMVMIFDSYKQAERACISANKL